MMLTIGLGIIVLVLYFNLHNRIDKLEDLIKGKNVPQPPAPVEPAKTFPTPVAFEANAPAPINGESQFDKFIDWLKDDWLLKFGVLLLLFGFGWFTTYAFIHNWIGPIGRITLGIVAGTLFLLLGNWRIKKFLHQGGAFLVLGSTTILITVFAAREVYDFFSPLVALVIMFLSTAFVAFVSVKYNNRALALASLILAGIAPLLTHAPANDYIGLFSYILVVVMGAIWITFLTGRRELTTAALVLVLLYSLPHLLGFAHADRGVLLLFSYAFASLFFLTNISALLKLKDEDITADVVTAGANGLLLLAWILNAAQDEWKSLIISAWTLVFLAGSYLIYKLNNNKKSFYTYAGLAVAMIVAATSSELDGASLTVAYAIESALVSFVIYYFLGDLKVASRASLLIIGPIVLSFSSFTSHLWSMGAFNKDFFVLLTLSVILFILGIFFWEEHKEASDTGILDVGPTLIKAGSVYAYALIWKTLHSILLSDDMAVMISLVIYTLVGIVTYFYGKLENRRPFKVYGGILLGLVIARLFLVDVWKMELTGKIITFFLLGALLVSTAFIGKKKQPVENINSIQV